MSHLIIKGIDEVFTPAGERWGKTWHGLETQMQGGIALDGSNIGHCFCPIVQCGLKPDFEAEVSNVPEDLRGEMDLTAYKLIVADCRKGFSGKVHPLYVPKQGYKIHQNQALFNSMVQAAIAVLGADNFEIVTAGTLGGYSQFFMSLAIKGQSSFAVGTLDGGKEDLWDKFFGLNTSHNGLIGSQYDISTVRRVCFNTVKMAVAESNETGTASMIKHTENSEMLITPQAFEANLKAWLTRAETFQAMLAACKADKMTLDGFKNFAAGVFTNAKSDSLSTVSYNRIETMSGLFQKGMGNVGATRYDAVNAFTEFFTHGDADSSMTVVKRVAMANFGRGNDWKNEAMAIATDEAQFRATVKRGKLLYADKVKVEAAAN